MDVVKNLSTSYFFAQQNKLEGVLSQILKVPFTRWELDEYYDANPDATGAELLLKRPRASESKWTA